ncbi:MAG: DMT family transporter [Terriglobales bacterium]
MASAEVCTRRRQAIADGSLLAVSLVWGVTFPVVKGALQDANPLSFCALRLGGAALLLALFFRPHWRLLPAATWGAGALLGLFLGSGYCLQTAGLEWTSPAAAAFITSISVVLVPLLLAVFWGRRLRARAWAGAAVALAGLYLLVAAPTAAGTGRAATWHGDALVGACALAFALQIVCLGEWAPRLGFRDLAVLQIVFAAIFTWIALPAVSHPQWHSTPRLWVALAITAVLATAVAFTVQSWAQQFTPATHTAVIFAAEPVFAWLASSLGWHEPLRLAQGGGAVLIVAAMLIVEWHPREASSGAAVPGVRPE